MYIPGKPIADFNKLKNLFLYKSSVFGYRNTLFFSRGRDALYVALKHLFKLNNTMRVWIPVYICRSVVDTIKECGLKHVYYDIDHFLKPKWKEISLEKDDLFIIVHFFGISQDSTEIKKKLSNAKAILIEDGAHTIPFIFYGSHGKVGDIAIFSLRKSLGVPDGGILVINRNIRNRSQEFLKLKGHNISFNKVLFMFAESFAFKFGINILGIKRYLKNNLFRNEKREIEGISRQTLGLLSAMDFSEIARKKVNNYNKLTYYLKEIKEVHIPFTTLPSYSIPQVLPIWSSNAEKLVERLRSEGIEAYQWPGDELPSDVNLHNFTGTREWVTKGIMLPLHHCLRNSHLERIAGKVRKALR